MFTGIIEEIGTIKAIVRGSRSIKLSIECSKILKDLKTGDSIAVNGVCLTVTEFSDSSFRADVMPETVKRTNLDRLSISSRVNLERALRLSDRLDGHIVSGHIDAAGMVIAREEDDNAIWLTVEAPADIMKYIVEKGSVALDGTSLTVAGVDEKSFKVSLIPFTSDVTTLGTKKSGDILNVECDIIGKYIEKLICSRNSGENNKSNITEGFLGENGFL